LARDLLRAPSLEFEFNINYYYSFLSEKKIKIPRARARGSFSKNSEGKTGLENENEIASVLENLLSQNTSTTKKAAARFWKHQNVPQAPSPTNLDMIKIPAPPQLDPDADEVAWFRAIAKTYTRAYNDRYRQFGNESYTFSRVMRNPRKSRYYKLVVEAARKFIKHEIPPASWIAFSFDVWHEYGGGRDEDDSPPVSWIFSRERVEKRWGWFYAESSRYRGGRILLTNFHKELIHRYDQMRSALSQLPVSASDATINVTVQQFFPDDLYEFLLEKSNAAARKVCEKLNESLRAGDWLWSDDWQIPENLI